MKYYSEAPNAPAAVGPYSIATEKDGFIFLSGQVPIVPGTGKLISDDITEQTTQVLENIKAVLSSLEIDFSHVMKTTIFLTDLSHFSTVNSVYEKALEGARPSRSTIQVAALPLGASVEIEMTAKR